LEPSPTAAKFVCTVGFIVLDSGKLTQQFLQNILLSPKLSRNFDTRGDLQVTHFIWYH
jgi:hypothetical protein